MPLAVTHVLLTIIIVDLFRDYILKNKKYLTLHTIMIAGIAGLLPDIDILISWLLNSVGYAVKILQHGGLTHTIVFGLIFLIPALILLKKSKYKMAAYFFVVCFGILFHLLLDLVLGGSGEGIMLFWPLSAQVYSINLLGRIGLTHVPAALNAAILLIWLWHEEIKHKIVDFI